MNIHKWAGLATTRPVLAVTVQHSVNPESRVGRYGQYMPTTEKMSISAVQTVQVYCQQPRPDCASHAGHALGDPPGRTCRSLHHLRGD